MQQLGIYSVAAARGVCVIESRVSHYHAAESQKIRDHSGSVWNCWTGSLAVLGIARANALQAKNATGAVADAARVRALSAYKDFFALWVEAEVKTSVYQHAQAEYRKLL